MRYLVLLSIAAALVSCNRDPNYVKQKNLDTGNKYFAANRLKEARIMYRRAIDADRKFGEAHYRLALTDLKLQRVADAVPELRRAITLLKPGTPSANDATLKLAEIMVIGAQGQENSDSLVAEVQAMANDLLKRNPNGWEGHKLSGDLTMLDVAAKYRAGKNPEARQSLAGAISEYRTALAVKPKDMVLSMALARTLVLSGDIQEAEGLYKGLIDRDKEPVAPYYELYRIYTATHRQEDAAAIMRRGIAAHPTDPTFRLSLAQFYFVNNNRPELTKLLDGMKSDLKSFPQAYIQSGDFYQRLNQPDEAIRQYEEGLQKDPGQKTTYLNHEVQTYLLQNKLTQATAKNEEILRIDPKNPDARQLKATALLDRGQVNQAMTELQSVVTAKPDNFVARFNLGRAHFARKEYDQARQEFDKAVELQPGYMPARYAQAQVAFLRGDNESALRLSEQILKLQPNSIQGLVMKSNALQRLGKNADSRALLMDILSKDPKQVDTLLELGVLDMNERKNKDAVEMFRRARESQPANLRGLLGESMAYLRDGQTDKSVQLIQDEVQKQPQNDDLMREMGNAQMAANRPEEAIKTYQTLLGRLKDPRLQGEIWTRVAQCYRLRNDLPHSIEAMEKARVGIPDNAALATNLGQLYDEAGRPDLARKNYETAIRIDPNSALALNNLAYLLTESNGDLNQAQTYAERAKRALPNMDEVTDTLGWIMLKKNLTDGALESFRTVVTKAPQNPTFHYHYAMALNQKGDRETARKECQAALANKPSNKNETEIRQLLAKLS